jgi:transketolase
MTPKKKQQHLDKMNKFQNEIYALAEKHVKGDEPETLFIASGIMMKTALEMYVSVLEEDEVLRVLQLAAQSVSPLKKRMHDFFSQITLH